MKGTTTMKGQRHQKLRAPLSRQQLVLRYLSVYLSVCVCLCVCVSDCLCVVGSDSDDDLFVYRPKTKTRHQK